MRNGFLFLFFLANSYVSIYGQLEFNGGKKSKGWQQTKAITQVTIEAFSVNNYRSLSPNPNFLNVPLGERQNEKAARIWSYGLGLHTGIGKWLLFDSGLQFIQNGESYSYEDPSSDSTLQYVAKYRYIGMPLSLCFHTGKALRIFLGPGITPVIFQQYVKSSEWTTALGSKKDDLFKERNNSYAASGLQVFGQIGLQYASKTGWGTMVKFIYRSQITNTYSNYNKAIHYANGWGFGVGITKHLK
ncbi:MAG: hypothetical protein EB023_06505 [Flavobacteriia bacterium]|nr:hypothetical protein [Flavobacteriia bacterium]